MSKQSTYPIELAAAEDRCAELHALWVKHESTAAFHKRHNHPDADRFQREADAWKADYEGAVRDLRRLDEQAG